MKIALFGASGMIGQRIAQESLARGHQVTGLERHPEKITAKHPNLTVQAANALDPDAVATAVAGHDVWSARYAGTLTAPSTGDFVSNVWSEADGTVLPSIMWPMPSDFSLASRGAARSRLA